MCELVLGIRPIKFWTFIIFAHDVQIMQFLVYNFFFQLITRINTNLIISIIRTTLSEKMLVVSSPKIICNKINNLFLSIYLFIQFMRNDLRGMLEFISNLEKLKHFSPFNCSKNHIWPPNFLWSPNVTCIENFNSILIFEGWLI